MIKFSEHFALETDAMTGNLPIGAIFAAHNFGWCLPRLRARLNIRLKVFERGKIVLHVGETLRTPEGVKILQAQGKGSRNSQHLEKNYYNAVDVQAFYTDPRDLVDPHTVAEEARGLFDYIKVYPDDGHVHLDHRDKVKKLKEELEDG